MAFEKLTKDEYNNIMFESLVRALAAMEEMFQKCEIEHNEKGKYLIIKRRLYKTTYEILKMKEKTIDKNRKIKYTSFCKVQEKELAEKEIYYE